MLAQVEPLDVVPRLELDEESKIPHWQLQIFLQKSSIDNNGDGIVKCVGKLTIFSLN